MAKITAARRRVIERAIKLAGGSTAMAEKIGKGLLPQHVNNWKHRGIPPKWVIPAEQACAGQVSRNEIAPELYPLEESA